MATLTSTRIPGDPVWLFIVGPSGGMKTELLRAFTDVNEVYSISKFTKNTLISGADKKSDVDMLAKLDNKCLIVKDFTTILSMNVWDRDEIFGQLRDCYDGYHEKACGAKGIGTKSYAAHFGFISGVTPVIDVYYKFTQELGERFLKVRPKLIDSKQAVVRASQNSGFEPNIRDRIRAMTTGFVKEKMEGAGVVSLPPKIHNAIIDLAQFVALGRTHVAKDRDGTLTYFPVPEHGTRIVKQFTKLICCLAQNRGKTIPTSKELEIVKAVALDSLPSVRLSIINAISQVKNANASIISAMTRLPYTTVARNIDDMLILDMVGEKETWMNNDPHTDFFLTEPVSNVMVGAKIGDEDIQRRLEVDEQYEPQ